MKESRYNFLYSYGNEGQALLYNSRTNALALLDSEHIEQYKKFLENGTIDKNFMEELEKGGYVIDDNEDELSLLKYELLNNRYRDDILSLTVAATSDCNFRCIYCYEKSSLKNSKMSVDIQDKLYDFIKGKINSIKHLYICWYGGEPLLVMDIIEKLSKQIISLCKTEKVDYSASIVTNGYLLTPEIAKKLREYKVSNMQITIDGPEEIHNRRRPLAGGQGTFKRIIENVKECKEFIENISIRINTDKENMNKINHLIQTIKALGVDGENISFYLGFVEPHNECYLDEKCMTAESFSKKHYEFMLDNGISLMNAYPRLTNNFCGADLKNSYVVDSEGLLYKCWNDVGIKERSIGTLDSEKEEKCSFNKMLFYSYILYDATEDNECKKCSYLPICMGGCPFKRLSKGNRCIDKKYILDDYLRGCADYLINQKKESSESSSSN